jgi:hypothetical protein
MLSFCGIDVSKDRLDVIVLPEEQRSSVSNDQTGWADLVERLRGRAAAPAAAATCIAGKAGRSCPLWVSSGKTRSEH